MTQVSFRSGSARAAQARLKRRLGSWGLPTLAAAGLLLLAAGIWLLSSHQNIGLTLVGLAIPIAMFWLWVSWHLSHLAPSAALTQDPVALDSVLEPGLLGALKWPTSPGLIWKAAIDSWQGAFVANRLGFPSDLAQQLIGAEESFDVWTPAIQIARNARLTQIDAGVVVAAFLTSHPRLSPVLTELKLEPADVLAVFDWQQRLNIAIAKLDQKSSFGGVGRDWASGYTPTLNHFAQNISREVESGYYRHLPQVHDSALDQVVVQLASARSSVALIGEVGSGKTSLVYSLAERLLTGDRAKGLEYNYVMSLNASVLISAGGQIEQVVLQLLSEAVHARNIIIFLDEAQMFFGTGTGAVDLTQILLPILQKSSLKLVLAMSPQDWQQLIGANPGIAGVVQRVAVPVPSQTDTLKIIEDAAIGIEHRTKTVISYQAIKEVYRLAERYLTETAFPGKGITLLESAANLAQGGVVSPESVQKAVEGSVGTKVTGAGAAEKRQLLDLEDQIHRRMINQDHAVKAVSDALRRARAGVRDEKRPVGSFLFLGPTGVGKTELARALADIYFGGQNQIIRVDMSEYQQPSDVDRLLAPAAGRTGNTLISAIRKQPFSVVLLDEVEKAHPDVLNLLLQILDEGRLTDTGGRTASFKDAIIIATSNAAADVIRQKIEAGQKLEQFASELQDQLVESKQFKPELLNRFDDIVLFRPLTKSELVKVVDLLIADVNKTLEPQKVKVALTPAAVTRLVDAGYDPRLGARPLRRMVQRAVENTVAKRILQNEAGAGSVVTLDAPDIEAA